MSRKAPWRIYSAMVIDFRYLGLFCCDVFAGWGDFVYICRRIARFFVLCGSVLFCPGFFPVVLESV